MIFLIRCKVIDDFAIGVVMPNSRFQYGAKCRSKGNGTNDAFPVNLYEL